jgi:hypothetical protein
MDTGKQIVNSHNAYYTLHLPNSMAGQLPHLEMVAFNTFIAGHGKNDCDTAFSTFQKVYDSIVRPTVKINSTAEFVKAMQEALDKRASSVPFHCDILSLVPDAEHNGKCSYTMTRMNVKAISIYHQFTAVKKPNGSIVIKARALSSDPEPAASLRWRPSEVTPDKFVQKMGFTRDMKEWSKSALTSTVVNGYFRMENARKAREIIKLVRGSWRKDEVAVVPDPDPAQEPSVEPAPAPAAPAAAAHLPAAEPMDADPAAMHAIRAQSKKRSRDAEDAAAAQPPPKRRKLAHDEVNYEEEDEDYIEGEEEEEEEFEEEFGDEEEEDEDDE